MHRFVDKKMSTGIISSEEKGNTLINLYLLVYIPILRWKQVRQLGAFPKSLEVLTRTRVERTIQTVHSLAPVSSAMLTRIQWSFGGAVAPDRMFIWDELSSPNSVLSWSMRHLSSLVNLSIMYTGIGEGGVRLRALSPFWPRFYHNRNIFGSSSFSFLV